MAEFVRSAWPALDPADYLHNWHIDAICQHLQAVTFGDIKRLLITIPPRGAKSLIAAVAWPAWTWTQGPVDLPGASVEKHGFITNTVRTRSNDFNGLGSKGVSLQGDVTGVTPENPPEGQAGAYALAGPKVKFLCASYSQTLSERDSVKTRRLILSDWYKELWSDRFTLRDDTNTVRKFENDAGGYRLATSVGGTLTGEGGDVLLVDDALNAANASYKSMREAANIWWDEAMSTRLNDMKTGAKVIIGQRLHEDDLPGHVLDREGGEWVHLMIPMRYESARSFHTVLDWEDPRTEEGELIWPKRWPEEEVKALETSLGPFAAAAQLQQSPEPRGGGIIRREWWQLWDEDAATLNGVDCRQGLMFPSVSYVVVSVDTAYGEKTENDYSACTVWGVWEDRFRKPKVVLMEAWRGRWPLLGIKPDNPLDTEAERKKNWGLVERVKDTCRRRRCDALLIEDKTRGKDLGTEVRKLTRDGEMSLHLIIPRGDKVSRVYATEPMFADGLVWAPDKAWADMVITEFSQFPKGRNDDLVDTGSQALLFLRQRMLMRLGTEAEMEQQEEHRFRSQVPALYDI